MKRFHFLFAIPFACAAVVLAATSGCESAEANDVTISPNNAKVSVGGSVGLTANGWDNFRWTLSDGDIGVLSATVGRSVVYTAISSTGTVQRVTATAIGSGATSSTSTNSTSSLAGYSATVVITHK